MCVWVPVLEQMSVFSFKTDPSHAWTQNGSRTAFYKTEGGNRKKNIKWYNLFVC